MARKQSPAAPDPGLNERQMRFAQEYAVDLNATQAAIRAGYEPATAGQTGHQLLKNPQIDAMIRDEMRSLEERTHISADFVMRGLLTNYHRALQLEPVMDRNGPTGEYKYDGAVANKALELIGKHIGMFREPKDDKPGGEGDLSLAELLRMLPDAIALLKGQV